MSPAPPTHYQPSPPLSSLEPHCSYRPPPSKKSRLFAPIKSDQEVEAARSTGIPAKTIQDTKYCMGVWEAWVKYRQTENGDTIGPIQSMNRQQIQHWLSRFVLEVGLILHKLWILNTNIKCYRQEKKMALNSHLTPCTT